MYELWNDPELLTEFLLANKSDWPRGKTLGGSSSINGLIFIRGQKEDYDTWRDLGNPGWGWDDVLPYFKKAEGNDRLSEPLHSQKGPLKASSIPKKHPLVEAFCCPL